jgi:hypothetical protein
MTNDDKDSLQDKRSPSISEEVEEFINHIDSLSGTLPNVMFSIASSEAEANDRFKAFAEKYGSENEKTVKSIKYSFPEPYSRRAIKLNTQLKQAGVANKMIPRVFVLALVSQYDAFLGRLLRALFLLKPELINQSDRSVTLSQLLDLGTIEGATEYLLEKEIESVLRKSHVEQFNWMAEKFNVKLTKDLDSWPILVELTERRNLFAHSNGKVSDQYIAVCSKNGVQLGDECVRGYALDVSPEYFECAYRCVYEIAVKLSQVLWRKIRPEQIEKADENLINITFNLLSIGKYNLACNLLDFACETLKKHYSTHERLILTINRAQAYKWINNEEKYIEILSKEDWSACGPQFHLAVAVLKDDFVKAARIMTEIGKNGKMRELDYQEWPLFKKFRKTDEFLEAYEKIFSNPFVHLEEIFSADEHEHFKQKLDKLKELIEKDRETLFSENGDIIENQQNNATAKP